MYTPRPLPGYAYPDSRVPSLPAAQRYEALLFALETKWRNIGEFCEKEVCRLNPRCVDAVSCHGSRFFLKLVYDVSLLFTLSHVL